MNNSWAREQARSGTDGSAAKSLATSERKEKSRNDVVRDDWEDDDEDEDEDVNPAVVEVRNKRIWDEANARESRPMPSVVMSRGTSIASVSSSLPLNEPPTMRILKRPSPSGNMPENMDTTIGESLQDREARYLAARERIFGTTTGTVEDESIEETGLEHHQISKTSSISSSSVIPSAQAIRELRGPDGANGFINNRGSKNTLSSQSKGKSEDSSV